MSIQHLLQAIEVCTFNPLYFLSILEDHVSGERFDLHEDVKEIWIQIILVNIAEIQF